MREIKFRAWVRGYMADEVIGNIYMDLNITNEKIESYL